MQTEKLGLNKWATLAKNFLGSDFFNELIENDKETSSHYPADVYHTPKEVIVLINLPGQKNIEKIKWLIVDNNKLKITGTNTSFFPNHLKILTERPAGKVAKEINLGAEVTPIANQTKYYRGILELHFLKK
ncbi:MAG: hypothetical protein RLZ12_964 [Bacillota bacterium]|jgi:HSP20 family molecular chaperone IbpA